MDAEIEAVAAHCGHVAIAPSRLVARSGSAFRGRRFVLVAVSSGG